MTDSFPPLVLEIVAPRPEALLSAARARIAEGARRIAILPEGELAQNFRIALQPLPEDCIWIDPDRIAEAELILIAEADADPLAEHLLSLVDHPGCRAIAPRSGKRGLDLPLFLISIPKSGTHLLMELADAMGFGAAQTFEWIAPPGGWYCLEFSNTHTAAPDFFIDSVRRAPFGNRLHPFPASPALFIYRHPLDILVSEANYYHRDGKTSFSGYLAHLSFEDRLKRLAADPWLMGSLRDRVGKFAAWLDFSNVIPLSFEELVGPAGGGDAERQRRAIWSVLLKLEIAGDADAIARKIFNPASATFEKGRMGRHRELLTRDAAAIVARLDRDFFDIYGYAPETDSSLYSRRIDEFRRRPLKLAPPVNRDIPALIENDFLGHNLVQYRNHFFGVPVGGPVDLTRLGPEKLAALPNFNDIKRLRTLLVDLEIRRRTADLAEDFARREAELERRIAALEAGEGKR